jgi:hypothetical protein
MGLDSTGAHRLGLTGSHSPISATSGHLTPVSRQAEPAYRDYAAEVAEAAQYSAVPYSASPYSIAPQSVAPNSVAAHSMAPAQVSPQSVAPYSAVPYSTVPYQRSLSPQDTGSWYREKSPATSYPDDLYSTGSMPRAAYPDYESAAPEPSVPAYPASWGSAPDPAAAVRPEFRSGPRARFSR